MKTTLIALLISSFINFPAFAVSNEITHEEINHSLLLKHIGQVSVSPDGKQVAYTIRQFIKDHKGIHNLYSFYLNTAGTLKLLSKGNINISNINWLPDGKRIAFLAKGSTYQSIWIIEIQTSKIYKLLEFTSDINAFKWSPDGKSFAIVADAVVSDKYHVGRLYLVRNIDKNLEITPLTSLQYNIVQLSDLLNDNGFDWSPDGRSIVFSYQTRNGSFLNDSYKIAIIDLTSRLIKNISYTNNHDGIRPIYSPDGKWIAFSSNLAASKVVSELNNCIYFSNRVCVLNLKSQRTSCLSNTFNENPALLGWNQSSDNVLAKAGVFAI